MCIWECSTQDSWELASSPALSISMLCGLGLSHTLSWGLSSILYTRAGQTLRFLLTLKLSGPKFCLLWEAPSNCLNLQQSLSPKREISHGKANKADCPHQKTCFPWTTSQSWAQLPDRHTHLDDQDGEQNRCLIQGGTEKAYPGREEKCMHVAKRTG